MLKFPTILQVVDKPTPIPPGAWVAINSHSFGGSYGHVVLKPNLKNKVIKYDGVPRLVLLADRTNDYMNDLFNQVSFIFRLLKIIILLGT